MTTFLMILVGILMFGLLIAVHEFGHFVTAKLCGVRVNEFAIGMGPKLFSKQGKETLYSLRLFPIGGYCAMEGEDVDTDDPRSFMKAKAWKKLLILVAGAFMNFVLGLLIFFFICVGSSTYSVEVVGGFEPWSTLPAQGLQVGDRFVKIDGHSILTEGDASIYLGRAGSQGSMEVLRDGKRVVLRDLDLTRTPVPQEDGSTGYKLGVNLSYEDISAGFGDKLRLTWYNTINTVRRVWMSLGDLVTGQVGLRELSGPVGIVNLMGDVASQEEAPLANRVGVIFYLIAFIAVNLAVMNLLPIPALDGGRVFFLLINVIYTAITKKTIDPKYEGVINAIGLVALLGLMAVVMVSDILKIFGR